jgi:hypothetical protein
VGEDVGVWVGSGDSATVGGGVIVNDGVSVTRAAGVRVVVGTCDTGGPSFSQATNSMMDSRAIPSVLKAMPIFDRMIIIVVS